MSFMLSVTNETFTLSVIMLYVMVPPVTACLHLLTSISGALPRGTPQGCLMTGCSFSTCPLIISPLCLPWLLLFQVLDESL
jgi:hypothetical protein